MALQTDSLKQKLYFAINSGVPGLEGIPPMKQQNIDRHSLSNIPNFLRLSAETRSAIELHIASVGIEVRRYDYGCRDQGASYQVSANQFRCSYPDIDSVRAAISSCHEYFYPWTGRPAPSQKPE
jgi:hypothetical protein